MRTLATEDLTVYTILRTTWTLSTAASYTIGTGATVNVARPTGPMAIDSIGFQDTSVSPTMEYALGPVLTVDAYAAIAQKGLTSVFPQNWYYDPTYTSGFGTLYPYPVPTSATLEGVARDNNHPLGETARGCRWSCRRRLTPGLPPRCNWRRWRASRMSSGRICGCATWAAARPASSLARRVTFTTSIRTPDALSRFYLRVV